MRTRYVLALRRKRGSQNPGSEAVDRIAALITTERIVLRSQDVKLQPPPPLPPPPPPTSFPFHDPGVENAVDGFMGSLCRFSLPQWHGTDVIVGSGGAGAGGPGGGQGGGSPALGWNHVGERHVVTCALFCLEEIVRFVTGMSLL